MRDPAVMGRNTRYSGERTVAGTQESSLGTKEGQWSCSWEKRWG